MKNRTNFKFIQAINYTFCEFRKMTVFRTILCFIIFDLIFEVIKNPKIVKNLIDKVFQTSC